MPLKPQSSLQPTRSVLQALQIRQQTHAHRMQAAMHHAPMGQMLVGTDGHPLQVNAAACRILGYSETELLQQPIWNFIHPEDQEDIEQIRVQLQDSTVSSLDQEKRFLHKDGHVVWIQRHLSVVRDSAGTPQQFVVQFSDISERKKAEQERDRAMRYLQAQTRISRLLEDNLPPEDVAREASWILAQAAGLDYTGLMTVKGNAGHVTTVYVTQHASEAFLQATQQPIPRGKGLSWRSLESNSPMYMEYSLKHPGARAEFVAAGVTAVAYIPLVPLSSKTMNPLLFVASWLNGNRSWTEEDRNLLDSAGRSIRVALERQEQMYLLEQAALHDALTGLGNRRAFEQDLQAEHARARRHGHPLGVMVLDLDGLKTINDGQGHEAGDRVLQAFGRELRQHMRLEDRCYRLGGDEFAVILAHSPIHSSETIHLRVQDLIREVQEQDFPEADVSAGIAFYPEECQQALELLHLADERMYQMKARHRGKT
ncbi:sensor domain-containing diguanylate cyclase [Deinococcus roseus]|uniref:Diguanylate cyclase n=1 Tax=Deinococcus roseus TaxID=392414 RepID=A0ABQ2D5Z2_9DEIO|nr:sensor domain-containing diguanylate cyclase [Deinococcus roseus]GGJ47117.1 hypothetical protein GCM10008938_36480 [Deinococcus roseus]